MEHVTIPAQGPFSLVVHGGAGGTSPDGSEFGPGLQAAMGAGCAVLNRGGAALDAVVAAVEVLEDDPAFNAGRGAALNTAGQAELDAALMDGSTGQAGAVISSRYARHPIQAARAVAERTVHVLLVDPPRDLLREWAVEDVDPGYFITERRLTQLKERTGDTTSIAAPPARGQITGHGTVGAVARDTRGRLAAATSTGGVTGQLVGRVGDSPIPGAGTWADTRVAISCTGIGEYFLRSALAHDVAARMRLLGDPLAAAVDAAFAEGIEGRGGQGGIIAVDRDGTMFLRWNTPAMLRGHLDGPGTFVWHT